ncbi:MAG: hypothetical protein AAB758_00825 [Patescibacteria group bacterium]
MNRKIRTQGSSLVEALVAVSIFLVVVISVTSVSSFLIKNSLETLAKVQAAYLTEEGLEVMRLFRDVSWSNNIASLVSGDPFSLTFDGEGWDIVSVSAPVDGTFSRTLMLGDVYRDGSGNIVASGGTLDPNTKKITSTISWNSRGGLNTRSLSTYLTNIFNN